MTAPKMLMLPPQACGQARAFLGERSLAPMPLTGTGRLFECLFVTAVMQAPLLSIDAMQTAARALVDLLDAMVGDAARASFERAPGEHLASAHRQRVRAYALSRLHDPDLDVRAIAGATRLSVRHVHHLFSSEGTSLMRWIWSQRLERCRHQHPRGEPAGRRVSDVAYAWGFRDANHFSRAFRKAYGVPPSAVIAGD